GLPDRLSVHNHGAAAFVLPTRADRDVTRITRGGLRRTKRWVGETSALFPEFGTAAYRPKRSSRRQRRGGSFSRIAAASRCHLAIAHASSLPVRFLASLNTADCERARGSATNSLRSSSKFPSCRRT